MLQKEIDCLGRIRKAAGARAIGVPGCPELAAWTASIDSVRIVLMHVASRAVLFCMIVLRLEGGLGGGNAALQAGELTPSRGQRARRTTSSAMLPKKRDFSPDRPY
jgi:hypothetical protein